MSLDGEERHDLIHCDSHDLGLCLIPCLAHSLKLKSLNPHVSIQQREPSSVYRVYSHGNLLVLLTNHPTSEWSKCFNFSGFQGDLSMVWHCWSSDLGVAKKKRPAITESFPTKIFQLVGFVVPEIGFKDSPNSRIQRRKPNQATRTNIRCFQT